MSSPFGQVGDKGAASLGDVETIIGPRGCGRQWSEVVERTPTARCIQADGPERVTPLQRGAFRRGGRRVAKARTPAHVPRAAGSLGRPAVASPVCDPAEPRTGRLGWSV